jgi:hypothetical protein
MYENEIEFLQSKLPPHCREYDHHRIDEYHIDML